MDTLAAVISVLRSLVDAAFSSGGITDAKHTELHASLNAVDPAAAQAEQAAQEAADAEAADRASYEAWKASQSVPTPAIAEGTEGTGFGG